MGIYWFAVDYYAKEQMWAPKSYADKTPSVYYPGHPLPCMLFMKNTQGCNFEVVNDVSTYTEHEFKDVTEEVFKELCEKFPNYKFREDE
jgi:hypothetical protein